LPTPTGALRRKLVLYALALSYVVTILAAIVLVVLDKRLTRDEVLGALGLNLMSSAVFGIIFATLSSRVQEQKLEADLEDKFDRLARGIAVHLAESNKKFLPASVYLPSDGFDTQFNADLSRSISGSSFYGFRGLSPRYVPPRLLIARHPPQQVRVCSVDPAEEKILARHASDRRMRPGLGDIPLSELVEAVRREIVVSIVALFDCRHVCPVELVYTQDTSVDRVEILDDSIYVSWYHGPSSPGHLFPEAYRYLRGSVRYETERLDMNRKAEICEKRVLFSSSHRETDLAAHLNELTGSVFDSMVIDKARSDHAELVASFIAFLQTLSADG
jgi:hypothetical protein